MNNSIQPLPQRPSVEICIPQFFRFESGLENAEDRCRRIFPATSIAAESKALINREQDNAGNYRSIPSALCRL
jgi:hypothetical protein